MRIVVVMIGAAMLLAACADRPLGRMNDRPVDPGQPRPNTNLDVRP